MLNAAAAVASGFEFERDEQHKNEQDDACHDDLPVAAPDGRERCAGVPPWCGMESRTTCASGAMNSRSACHTIKTEHGALRTTRSATLPISSRSNDERPCVPITMRSIFALVA